MSIDELFQSYDGIIFGCRIEGDIKIIDFWLNQEWDLLKDQIPGHISVDINQEYPQNNLNYCLVYTKDGSFQELHETITFIIGKNTENEKRKELFEKKLEELTQIFLTKPLEELEKIEFNNLLKLKKQTITPPKEKPKIENVLPLPEPVKLEEKKKIITEEDYDDFDKTIVDTNTDNNQDVNDDGEKLPSEVIIMNFKP